MKIVFLDAATMGSTPLTEIEKLGELTTYDSSTAEEARERVKDADVALLNKIIVNKEFLDAAPKLKLICEAGTGMNNIDLKLCEERGVAARNVAGYSTDSVAQITWTLILPFPAGCCTITNMPGMGATPPERSTRTRPTLTPNWPERPSASSGWERSGPKSRRSPRCSG